VISAKWQQGIRTRIMTINLPEKTIYQFIIKDFESAWNSIACNMKEDIGRGNFIFAFKSMNLLEFACRMCYSDRTGVALRDFSNNLYGIEKKYFTHLPALCVQSHKGEFTLPHIMGQEEDDLLLSLLFDLIRHGVAHEYQQITADLLYGERFFITLSGADYPKNLGSSKGKMRNHHLDCYLLQQGDIGIQIHPNILYLDFRKAIDDSNLFDRGLTIKHLKKCYNFDATQLKNSLRNGGHNCVNDWSLKLSKKVRI
jgi:hypothetical protein